MTGGLSENYKKHCHFKITNKHTEIYILLILENLGKLKLFHHKNFYEKYDNNFDSLNKNYNIEEHFDFLQKTIKPHQKICKILLNQKLFPGVGNYIKSETLYLSNIHPEQSWNLITIIRKKS